MATKTNANAKFETSRLHKAVADVVDFSAAKIKRFNSLETRSAGKKKRYQQVNALTAKMREKELFEWEKNKEIQVLRKMLLILCWSAVALFVLIPAGFSIAYAISFPDTTSWKW